MGVIGKALDQSLMSPSQQSDGLQKPALGYRYHDVSLPERTEVVSDPNPWESSHCRARARRSGGRSDSLGFVEAYPEQLLPHQ